MNDFNKIKFFKNSMRSSKPLFIIVILATLLQLGQSQIGLPSYRKFLILEEDASTTAPAAAPVDSAAATPAADTSQDSTQQQTQPPADSTQVQQTDASQQLTQDGAQNPPVVAVQASPVAGQNTTDASGEKKEDEEKNLMLVVPFSQEQFEAEMKMESLRLMDDSKKQYENNLQALRNITVENKKIIDQKKELIKLYMNHTTEFLDSQINILQRELEQNHEIMLTLARAILLTTLDDYEKKIANFRIQIEDILIKVDPPLTICERIMSCDACILQQDCVWSPDRRACFIGSKYDGCFFDYCEFHMKEFCVSNALVDRQEQVQLDHYTEDEHLALIMDEIYGVEEVELAAQRIPQPQKNYYFQLQNKLIGIKDKIQRVRLYINYIKKVYFKLRYQNIIFKRKREKQKEEHEKFLKELETSKEEFLKHIKETEEEKQIGIDELIKNEKALEEAEAGVPIVKQKDGEKPFDETLKVSKDGTITLSNGEVLEGLRVVDGKIIDETTGEERTDLKFVNGRIVGEDGKPISAADLKAQLLDEEGFMDGLLSNWFGDEYESSGSADKLSTEDKKILGSEKDPTVIDLDSDQIASEEQTILEYVSDQVKKQKEMEQS